MSNGIVTIVAGLSGKLFPERQIYLRSNGRVRYLNLSPAAQFIYAVIFVFAFSWMFFATVSFAYYHGAMAGRNARYDELRRSRDLLAAELAQTRNRLLQAGLAANSGKQDQVIHTINEMGAGSGIPSVAENPLVANTRDDIADPTPRPRPRTLLEEPVRVGQDVRPRIRPARAIISLRSAMTVLDARTDYSPPHGLRLLSGQPDAREEVLAHLAGNSNTAITVIEKLINQTGLDADTILRRRNALTPMDNVGEGGPLLAHPPVMTDRYPGRNSPGGVSGPNTRKGRLTMLREALFSLPLAEPVDKYYVSSGFGYRRDPFTHSRAFHSGMDLVAAYGDPVLSSAPGTVIFAERNGPYGNMIEVDHGRGVKSRYGHLSRISVKTGQKIGLRDIIGYVGNTGRSGTAHLHFEVWFDGKARDPRNFLKAGENVFQQQG